MSHENPTRRIRRIPRAIGSFLKPNNLDTAQPIITETQPQSEAQKYAKLVLRAAGLSRRDPRNSNVGFDIITGAIKRIIIAGIYAPEDDLLKLLQGGSAPEGDLYRSQLSIGSKAAWGVAVLASRPSTELETIKIADLSVGSTEIEESLEPFTNELCIALGIEDSQSVRDSLNPGLIRTMDHRGKPNTTYHSTAVLGIDLAITPTRVPDLEFHRNLCAYVNGFAIELVTTPKASLATTSTD